MSAIVGICDWAGTAVNRHALQCMIDRLVHRGSDRVEIWLNNAAGFGHRLLWTTPESLVEQLPLVKGDRVITADARIDNRHDLISTLELGDQPCEKITDSALILAAYERWGADCVRHLRGDFAFAIWDQREQQLFCARDPMGVKPFYYYHAGNLLVFASEIKALFAIPQVPRQLNEVKIADHLLQICEDRRSTFYQHIVALEAAHCLIWNRQTFKIQRYWSLDPTVELRLATDMDYAQAFHTLFAQAVGDRLRSAFPIASTLSGGLDSSSITCLARDALLRSGSPYRLHTLSAIFPSLPEADLKAIDERPYIQAVIDMGGITPHHLHADQVSPLVDHERLMWHQDEPLLAPNLYLHWSMYDIAQQQGVRVVLDGIDGDTTVSHGITYLTELARTCRWWRLFTEVKALAHKSTWNGRAILWQYGLQPLLPALWVQFGMRRRASGLSGATSPHSLLNPAFAQRIDLESRLSMRPQPQQTARAAHLISLRSPLIQKILETADRATSAFSLEARYPFCDQRLIEFCLSLPAEQKLYRGWTRAVLHRSMIGTLPPLVQSRCSKANLGANFLRNLLEYEQPLLDDLIVHRPEALAPYVDLAKLQAAYRRYQAQPTQTAQEALWVYSTATLALWLRSKFAA